MSIDLEAARKLLENRPESSESEDKFRWAKLPDDGSMELRFLPPTEGAKLPGLVVAKHYNIPEVNSVPCLSTFGVECPVCKMLQKYEGRLDLGDWGKSLRAYFNVLVIDKSEYPGGLPYILGTSDYTLYWLLEQILDPKVGDVTDIMEGHSITFKRQRIKGPFDRTITLKSSPIAETEDGRKEILDNMFKLEEIWRLPDEEYTKGIITASIALELVIKERLIKLDELEKVSNSIPDLTTSPEDTPKESSKESPPFDSDKEKKEDVSGIETPSGAPTCFGKEHSATEKKCLLCPHEYLCESAK